MFFTVHTGNSWIPEKKYVFDFLFGSQYQLNVTDDDRHYLIQSRDGSELRIKNSFFKPEDESRNSLWSEENLPKDMKKFSDPNFSGEEIVVMYGNSRVQVTTNANSSMVECEIDIVASIYFMLTRWEEYLPQEYDKLGRLQSKNNTSVKYDFYLRPVVDEWTNFMWDLLAVCNRTLTKPVHSSYRLNPTHDVDRITYPADILNMLGDIKSARDFTGWLKRLKHKWQNTNPYDTFDFLMDMSEQNQVKSVFYFMADGRARLDNKYRAEDALVKQIVSRVKSRNHRIGLHPGFNTYNDKAEFIRQKEYVESYTGTAITHSRQHYLKLIFPDTLSIWEKAGIEHDSSLGFIDRVGFRCGTGRSFPLFHVTERRLTNVMETPLVFMEGALHRYADLEESRKQTAKLLQQLKSVSIKYNSPFTILFHNSSFDDIRWPGWAQLYEEFMTS